VDINKPAAPLAEKGIQRINFYIPGAEDIFITSWHALHNPDKILYLLFINSHMVF
jgi:hypothetical protein